MLDAADGTVWRVERSRDGCSRRLSRKPVLVQVIARPQLLVGADHEVAHRACGRRERGGGVKRDAAMVYGRTSEGAHLAEHIFVLDVRRFLQRQVLVD